MNRKPRLEGCALYCLIFFVFMALLSPQLLTPTASASVSVRNQLFVAPHAIQPPEVQITIDPANPTESDMIQITASGDWKDACVPSYQFHHIEENTIYLQAVLPASDTICLTAITPWEFTVDLGSLPAGEYTIPFVIVMNDGTPIYETTASFTVTSATIQGPTPTPTAVPTKTRLFLPFITQEMLDQLIPDGRSAIPLRFAAPPAR